MSDLLAIIAPDTVADDVKRNITHKLLQMGDIHYAKFIFNADICLFSVQLLEIASVSTDKDHTSYVFKNIFNEKIYSRDQTIICYYNKGDILHAVFGYLYDISDNCLSITLKNAKGDRYEISLPDFIRCNLNRDVCLYVEREQRDSPANDD